MMTVLQEDLDFLAHFGKKGMKWGVRNKTQKPTSQRVTSQKKTTSNSPQYRVNLKPRTQKVMNGAGIAAGILVAAGGFTIASIYSRKADTLANARITRQEARKQWVANGGVPGYKG